MSDAETERSSENTTNNPGVNIQSTFEQRVEHYRNLYNQAAPNIQSDHDTFKTLIPSLHEIKKTGQTETLEDDKEAFEKFNAQIVAFSQFDFDQLIEDFVTTEEGQSMDLDMLRSKSHEIIQSTMLKTYKPFETLMFEPESTKKFTFNISDRQRATAFHLNYLANYALKQEITDPETKINLEKDTDNKIKSINLENLRVYNSRKDLTQIVNDTITFENELPVVTEEKAQELSDRLVASNMAGINASMATFQFAEEVLGLDTSEIINFVDSITSEEITKWANNPKPTTKRELLGWFSLFSANSNWQISQEPKFLIDDKKLEHDRLGLGSSRLEPIKSMIREKGMANFSQNLDQIKLGFKFIAKDLGVSPQKKSKLEAEESKELDLDKLRAIEVLTKAGYIEQSTAQGKEFLMMVLNNQTEDFVNGLDNYFIANPGILTTNCEAGLLVDLDRYEKLSDEQRMNITNGLSKSMVSVMERARDVVTSEDPNSLYSDEEKEQATLVDANYKAGVISDIEKRLTSLRGLLESSNYTKDNLPEELEIEFDGKKTIIKKSTAEQIFQLKDNFGIKQTEEGKLAINESLDFWNPISISEAELVLNALPSWDMPQKVFYTKNSEGLFDISGTEIKSSDGIWAKAGKMNALLTAKNFSGVEAMKNLLANADGLGGKEFVSKVIPKVTFDDIVRVTNLMNAETEIDSAEDLVILTYLRYANATWQTFKFLEGVIDAKNQLKKTGKQFEELAEDDKNKIINVFHKRIGNPSFMPYSDLLATNNFPEIDKDIQQGIVALQLLTKK